MTNRRSNAQDAAIQGLALVLAGITALLVVTPFVSGAAKSKEAMLCGGENNQVEAEFDLVRAKEIWQRLPGMLRAPELEEDSAPAHVVVFKGDFDLNGLVAIQAQANIPVVQGVVCVIQSDGTPNLYDSVSMVGARLD